MLRAPELLIAEHDLGGFDSGKPSLDDWPRRRAMQNQASGAARTFVVRDDDRVAGYYALAASAVAPDASAGRFRRNMPDPVPVAVLGRLAIDKACQGKGLDRALWRDAHHRADRAASERRRRHAPHPGQRLQRGPMPRRATLIRSHDESAMNARLPTRCESVRLGKAQPRFVRSTLVHHR